MTPFDLAFGQNNTSSGGMIMPMMPQAQPMSIQPLAQSTAMAQPGTIPGITPGVAQGGIGFNLPTANLALGGIQTIGNLWNAWEQRKLAQEQFKFQKGVTETNLKNQIASYNTTLEDRSRSRAHTEGQDQATADAYVSKNRLSR